MFFVFGSLETEDGRRKSGALVAAIGAAAPGDRSRCGAGGRQRPQEARRPPWRNTACGAGTIADSAPGHPKDFSMS